MEFILIVHWEKIPYIALGIFDYISISAFIMWMLYSTSLYLITQKWIIGSYNMKKQCALSIIFGLVSAFAKGSIDFAVEKLSNYLQSVIKLAYLDQATTFIFYILLTFILLVIIGKGKICFKKKNIKVPLCIAILVLLSYVGFVGNYIWQNQAAIRAYNANEEEMENR